MKNVLKSISLMTLMGTLILASSCSKDDLLNVIIDEEAPIINLSAPTDGAIVAAGSQVASSISISDNTEISSVSITLGNEVVTVLNITESDINDDSFDYNQNITIPADVVLGEHTLEITATDSEGNSTTSSITLSALPVYTDGQTTILLNEVTDQVDDYTEENAIHMVGFHQGDETGAGAWDPTSGSHPLSIYTDSEGSVTYFIQLENTGVEGFKLVRGTGGWDFGEKGPEGEEIDNRVIEAGATSTILDPIASWKDYNPDVQDNSSATVIDGTGTTSIEIKGRIVPALTTAAAISSASYAVYDESEVVVASGSVAVDSEGNYAETFSIETLGLGAYDIQVLAIDANNSTGRGDAALNIVEFPCDDSGETAVAGTMTRIIVNVPTTDDDLYATGNFDGDIWGTVDDAYKLTKLGDGCYYIDLALTSGQIVQVFRSNAGYADWWRGQATNTEGSDATANYNVEADSNGNTVKLFYAYWREQPN